MVSEGHQSCTHIWWTAGNQTPSPAVVYSWSLHNTVTLSHHQNSTELGNTQIWSHLLIHHRNITGALSVDHIHFWDTCLTWTTKILFLNILVLLSKYSMAECEKARTKQNLDLILQVIFKDLLVPWVWAVNEYSVQKIGITLPAVSEKLLWFFCQDCQELRNSILRKKKKKLFFPLFKTNKKPRRNTKCSLTAFSVPQRPTAYITQTDRFPPPILQISTPSPSELILWDLDPSQVRLTWSIFNGCHWLFHPVSQQLLQFKTAATLLPLWRNTGLRIYRNYSSAS